MITPNEPVAYINGAFVPESRASISIFDRAFRFADAVFDTSRTMGHKPYMFRAHLERLWRSLAYARLDPGLSLEQMERLTVEVAERNLRLVTPNDDLWVRQFVTRGPVKRVDGEGYGTATVVITTERLNLPQIARGYQRGVPLLVPSVRMVPTASFDPRMKTTSRMANNLAEQEVSSIDPEAYPLMLDVAGFVSESTGANFFAVKDGTLLTAEDADVLMGISRGTVLDLAARLGIPCRKARMTLYDVEGASEAFLTGTSYCILPVRSVNGRALGKVAPGPTTRALMDAWIKSIGHDFVAQALSHLDPGS